MSTEIARIRFYDDDPNNLEAVKRYFPDIECIHVPPTDLVSTSKLTGPDEYFNFIETHGGWNFAGEDGDLGAVLAYLRRYGLTTERVVVQGLTGVHFADIRAWADALPDPPAPYIRGNCSHWMPATKQWASVLATPIRGKLFLDWDEVVSQLEGYSAPRNLTELSAAGVTPLGYLKLCMGSRARYEEFTNLIKYLIDDKKIEVHVVTNNGGCRSKDAAATFLHMAKSLHPDVTVNCCNEYGANKGACIAGNNIMHLESVRLTSFGRLTTSFGTFKKAYQKRHPHVTERRVRAKFQKGIALLFRLTDLE